MQWIRLGISFEMQALYVFQLEARVKLDFRGVKVVVDVYRMNFGYGIIQLFECVTVNMYFGRWHKY